MVSLMNFTFAFESDFDFQGKDNFVLKFRWVSASVSVVYLMVVFQGRSWMAERERFHLRGPLIFWNLGMAVFSICGFMRMIPELVNSLSHFGFEYSVCNNSSFRDPPGALWSFLFIFSKFLELVDTLFIVLRKTPLTFLHWYHHAIVLVYSFFTYMTSTARWFIVMNCAAHSLMYSYFTLRAMSVRVPLQVNMGITLFQLVEMTVGCYINYSAYYYKMNDHACSVSLWNIYASAIMYGSFFILFANLFVNAYLRDRRHPATPKQKYI